MVCLPAEVEAFNTDGARVRLPIRGRKDPIELDFAQAAGQPVRGGHQRRQPYRLRPRGPGDAGAAVPLARRSRIAGRGGAGQAALHVDHEHAAAALPEAHPRTGDRRVEGCLHGCERVGPFRARAGDLVQSGPAGHPSSRRKNQRAAGHLADQLQGRPLRLRRVHRRAAADAGRHRSRPLGPRRRRDRAAGQAQGARFRSSSRWPSGPCC